VTLPIDLPHRKPEVTLYVVFFLFFYFATSCMVNKDEYIMHEEVLILKFPELFTTVNNVIILMEGKNGGTLGCLACHVTATLKLLREVN